MLTIRLQFNRLPAEERPFGPLPIGWFVQNAPNIKAPMPALYGVWDTSTQLQLLPLMDGSGSS